MTKTATIEFGDPVQEMIAQGDTLIITDPCYIMKDEDWEQFLDLDLTANPIGLDNYLRKYHNFGEVIAADTGIGDWSNTVYNCKNNEDIGHFAADAGMVIVCTASDLTNYGVDADKIQKLQETGCLVSIPDYSGHIQLYYEEKFYEGATYPCKLAIIEAIGDTEEDLCWSTEHWGQD